MNADNVKSESPRCAEVSQQIRAQLESEQQRIIGEISSYPAPRPNCDADFNHLLETRARISDDMNRLQVAHSRREIEDLIATTDYLDDDSRQKIASMIAQIPH